MKINNHRLEGETVKFKESPNHGGTFSEGLPDTIIIHFTAGSSAESSVRVLCDPDYKASAHLVIGLDNSITQLVPFNVTAWHAGRSSYGDRNGLNKYSIGIEIDNPGRLKKTGQGYISWFGRNYPENVVVEAMHRNESELSYWHIFTEQQISIVHDICAELINNNNISSVLGHEEISPGRKIDPGPAFPLDKIRDRLFHHDRSEDESEGLIHAHSLGVVTATELNIRSGPSVNKPKVAPALQKGLEVEILNEESGWYQVKLSTLGWVKKDYINVQS